MPVEVMARRGYDTLCYGPLKPVGLTDPHGCAFLHKCGAAAAGESGGAPCTIWSVSRTHLTFPEQRRVFRDPRTGECGIPTLWRHAPQHLPSLAGYAGTGLLRADGSERVLRRADDRRGRVHRIDRIRFLWQESTLPPRAWHGAGHFPDRDHDRRDGKLCQPGRHRDFPP